MSALWTRCIALAAIMLAAAPALTRAHVGSPNVFFEGKAGPHNVRVVVRPPSVVPGLADVVIRIIGGAEGSVTRVTVQPVFWRAGSAGAPSPDEARRVPGERQTYSGQLWLMARGAYSVYVTVEGPAGTGTAVVPVMSAATTKLGLAPGMRAILSALCVLLLAGLVTIVYNAAGESLVAPDQPFDASRRRRARVAALFSLPVVALILLGGARWWSAVDVAYERAIYRPLPTRASIQREAGRAIFELVVVDSAGAPTRNLAPVLPDHGKMMHLFLVDSASMRTFAHLHPTFSDGNTFRTALPPLPPGRYRAYGDVVYELGSDRTLQAHIDVTREDSAAAAQTAADADDAWITRDRPAPAFGSNPVDTLADGATLAWLTDGAAEVRAGRETPLHFVVRERNGKLAELEPYLGMAAHAVVMRDDGAVFIHLHPMGTVSQAAQQVFLLRDRGDTTAQGRLRLPEAAPASASSSHTMPMTGEFSFPYEFPQAGNYRVWVQVKRGGRILTGAFDVRVKG
jgi:hypothetical protein